MEFSFIGLLTIVAYQALVEASFPRIEYFTLINGFVYIAYLTMATCIILNIRVDRLDRQGESAMADQVDLTSRWSVPLGFVVINLLSALFFYF